MDLLDKVESADSLTDQYFGSRFGFASLESNIKNLSPEQKIIQIGIQNKLLNIKVSEENR